MEPKLKNHVELVKLLGIADLEKGQAINFVRANVAGHLYGLNFNFGLYFLENRGYPLLEPPFFMRKGIMEKSAQLAEFDDQLYKGKSEEYVHMLNSTSTAIQRTMCAILENNQKEDEVEIPEALRPFMCGKSFIMSRKTALPSILS
ncbi:hypothetical protein SASPL_131889 [Salvia splendens]|uniref:Seryl-tRNA synthetase n=1 Tax=Salvia splendens TaxID=180675 RepID=A0A8X8X8N8_SALSN|nr:hypothetical protein SASPL_131889 [Salvia splendens]